MDNRQAMVHKHDSHGINNTYALVYNKLGVSAIGPTSEENVRHLDKLPERKFYTRQTRVLIHSDLSHIDLSPFQYAHKKTLPYHECLLN